MIIIGVKLIHDKLLLQNISNPYLECWQVQTKHGHPVVDSMLSFLVYNVENLEK